jgi:hypothetical protein
MTETSVQSVENPLHHHTHTYTLCRSVKGEMGGKCPAGFKVTKTSVQSLPVEGFAVHIIQCLSIVHISSVLHFHPSLSTGKRGRKEKIG